MDKRKKSLNDQLKNIYITRNKKILENFNLLKDEKFQF